MLEMAEDGTGTLYQLIELEVAAQRVRFSLLGRPDWFRVTAIAEELGVERDTVRGHANALLKLDLLERRTLEGQPRTTYEWRPTGRGRSLRQRMTALLDERSQEPDGTPAAVVVVALPGYEHLADELLASIPGISGRARWLIDR